VTIHYGFGLHFTRTGEYDRAIEWLKKAIELDPVSGFVHHLLGEAYAEQGNLAQGAAELQRAIELSGSNPHYIAMLAFVRRQAGDRSAPGRALSLLEQRARRTYVSPHSLALVYTSLEKVNEAVDLLERAYEQRDPWLSLIHVQPQFGGLRNTARFESLLRRMGLRAEQSMMVSAAR
jgi:tetratricopeptide (TPR) repeat protein